MKNKRLLIVLVMVSIILSLFCVSVSFAGSGSVDESSVSAHLNKNENYTLKCNKTGVYLVELIDEDEGSYTPKWSIKTGGKSCRLACVAKENSDGSQYYELCSSIGGSTHTAVYVVLQEGKSYEIKASSGTTGGRTLNVIYSNQYSSMDYRQSDYDSILVTDANNSSEETSGNLESIGSGLEVPDDATVTYKKVGFIDGTTDPFQKALARLLLAIGDFFMRLISDIVGEDVTITNLIFNKIDAVNPNFFDGNARGIGHSEITDAASKWYGRFRGYAIALYFIAILIIGIRLLLNSTPQGIVKAREEFVEWLKGFIYLLFMPWLIYFLFRINEALVQEVCDKAEGREYSVGSSITDGTEWAAEAVEFRSPEYVSKYTGIKGYGTDDTNDYYIKKVNDYASNFDLMRIARAYAGATYRLSYCFIWYILIGQLLTFIYIYYKRYFLTLFFIICFPIICIFQAIGIMKDGKARAVSGWLGEVISNIFTQFIHALVYVIVTSVVVDLLYDGIVSGKLINWIIIIVAINFVPKGEAIVRKILKALSSGSSAEGLGEHGLRKGAHAVAMGARNLFKK